LDSHTFSWWQEHSALMITPATHKLSAIKGHQVVHQSRRRIGLKLVLIIIIINYYYY
jgi:K+ transporter